MMLIKSYVAPSGIHGNGLYTAEDIKKGTKIWEHMEGLEVVIPVAALESMPQNVRDYLECYTYPHFSEPDTLVLDGDHGRFMNHCDVPNTDFTTPRLGYATTDIPAGAELTCNYRDFVPGFVPYTEMHRVDIAPAHVASEGNGQDHSSKVGAMA